MVSGAGPILGRRLIEAFGSADRVFDVSSADLERIEGIGATKARRMWDSLHAVDGPASTAALEREAVLAEKLGVRIVPLCSGEYPELLAQCPDAPLVLYVKGALPCPAGSYAVGIVGSRHCTPYGIEQAERFSTALSQSGLIVVSGGARGIDSAAHRAAARLNFPTVVVLGCGLAHCYPPENAGLFEQVVGAGGSLVSELPLDTPPASANFPARNRIIVGLSLGIVVIEAPHGSGALITARIALDEYNREVSAVPGRVDSRASEGSNDLLKHGEAAMATSPADVIDALESAARHYHAGTHESRFQLAGEVAEPAARGAEVEDSLARGQAGGAAISKPAITLRTIAPLSPTEELIWDSLVTPLTLDEVVRRTGLEAGVVQSSATMLELRRVLVRQGSRLARRAPNT